MSEGSGRSLAENRVFEQGESHGLMIRIKLISLLLEFIKPGRSVQSGFIERFNRSYREAVLDMFVFQSLSEVCKQTALWLTSTTKNDHKSLGHLTPRDIW
jgi:transposase InsO family protein